MLLFFSDAHLGRDAPATERANERALVACLESYAGRVEHLYLVGDIFDQYIEYRDLVPKGFVRLQGLLASWTDAGVPVTYLLGNHDPWHRDYFEAELGVRVVPGPVAETAGGIALYLNHGDGLAPTDQLYNRLKPLIRHPLPVWLYTRLLPGDAGYGFARWVKHRGRHEEVSPARVESLRAYAQEILKAQAARAVVMGHTHHHELVAWPEGVYLNLGFWHHARTFGAYEDGRLRLLRWNGSCPEEIQSADVT